jgi:hypothetical protein
MHPTNNPSILDLTGKEKMLNGDHVIHGERGLLYTSIPLIHPNIKALDIRSLRGYIL